jgi:soluble lytic murein transglycosylase-like protein
MLLFITASHQNHIPAGLLESVCYVESKYKTNAYHAHDGKGNSVGLCQIKLVAAQQMGFKGTEKELMQPATNIKYAAKFLHYQINRYHSTHKAVIAYNRGNAKGLTDTAYSRKVFAKLNEHKIVLACGGVNE